MPGRSTIICLPNPCWYLTSLEIAMAGPCLPGCIEFSGPYPYVIRRLFRPSTCSCPVRRENLGCTAFSSVSVSLTALLTLLFLPRLPLAALAFLRLVELSLASFIAFVFASIGAHSPPPLDSRLNLKNQNLLWSSANPCSAFLVWLSPFLNLLTSFLNVGISIFIFLAIVERR